MANSKQAPYVRGLKKGMVGNDVWAVNRALLKAGYLKGVTKPGAVYDQHTVNGIKRLQKAKKLAPISGTMGPKTFKALLPYVDAHGAQLIRKTAASIKKQTAPKPAVNKTGQKVLTDAAGYMVSKAWNIHYTQSGLRMQGVRQRLRPCPSRYPNYEDCSSSATYLYWLARWPDPNGLHYNGQGYTGTQIRHGKLVANPQIGDLVFYGPSTWNITHVAVYVGNGRVFSHGREAGPEWHPINYRPVRQIRRYH